jgi:hypothetical protein
MFQYKRGMKCYIRPYGMCVIESYDDTSGKYILRVLDFTKEIFYATREEIHNKHLTNW